jgi:adenosine deaminase
MQALPYLDHIIAVGLDSTEIGNPPSRFKEVMAHVTKV